MSDFETQKEMKAYSEGYGDAMKDSVMLFCNDVLRRVSWEDRTKILNYLLTAKERP